MNLRWAKQDKSFTNIINKAYKNVDLASGLNRTSVYSVPHRNSCNREVSTAPHQFSSHKFYMA